MYRGKVSRNARSIPLIGRIERLYRIELGVFRRVSVSLEPITLIRPRDIALANRIRPPFSPSLFKSGRLSAVHSFYGGF